MRSEAEEFDKATDLDEFDLDLRLGSVEVGDGLPPDIHASGSCTCSCGRTCTCFSQCSCQTCTCSCGDCDDDDW